MNNWIKKWIFPSIDSGVKILAQQFRMAPHHIYEMLSRMEPCETREFLEKLNTYHLDEGEFRQAAIPFMVFKLKAPNSTYEERRFWRNRFRALQISWNITDEDLEIYVEFIPYYTYR